MIDSFSTNTHFISVTILKQSNQKIMTTEDFQKKYKILKQIGKGTQGLVFLGENIETSEPVAVKRMVCNTDEMVVECVSEFNLVKSLEHPNIIKYYDLYKNIVKDEFTEEESTEIIYVMEVCQSSLTHYIQNLIKEDKVFDAVLLENWIKQVGVFLSLKFRFVLL